MVLKSYDWAINQREKGNCVMSGFHSKIEKDVLHFLLKGTQPVILALARGLKNNYEREIQKALSENHVLIITPFKESTKRVTSFTAEQRNRFMCDLADEIFVAYASPNGKLLPLIQYYLAKEKVVKAFDAPENEHLFNLGAERFVV